MTNKPFGVVDHWHWFRNTEQDRADICVLRDGTIVIWFVQPDLTVVIPTTSPWIPTTGLGKSHAEKLLDHLGYSEVHPDADR